ncbi:MAG: hypothetical protein GX427_09840 [Actinomycetales bacterium]|nr:hypothetical protein [Actinomycetales bacterium]
MTRSGLAVAAGIVLAVSACTSSIDDGAAPAATSGAAASSETPGETGGETTGAAVEPGPAEIDIALEALTSEHGEYAAYATYKAIIDEFGAVQPYTNILGSEQKHIDFLVGYLDGAGAEIPENPWLGEVAAPADLMAAAQAGIDAEIANVAMYDELLAREIADPALVDLLERLRGMSEDRHLPAFEAALANGGVGTAGGMGHGGGNG